MNDGSRRRDKGSDPFSQELARKRAQELGVSPEDLVQKVVNGQAVWVLKTEIYADLDKQRKLAVSPKVIRAIRGGENSLYGLIQANLEQAKRLLQEVGARDLWNPIERHDSLSSIINVERRGGEAATYMMELEDEIEKVKEKDPIHADAEKILSEMRQAQLDGRSDVVADISRSHADLLKRYQQRRKAIEPHIQSTRNYRMVLQKEYWKIMQIVWRLRDVLMEALEKEMESVSIDRFNEAEIKQFRTDRHFISINRNSFNARQREVSARCPALQDDAMDEWNRTLDSMRQLLEQQAAFYSDCLSVTSKYIFSDAKSRDDLHRMAFTQRSDKRG